ncbi:MAG: hypothetical protein AAF581_16100 [Planctomycetota bacterium]
MRRKPATSLRTLTVVVGVLTAALTTPAVADTVYLANGASIDGVVVGERDGVVIVSIGNLGRVTLDAAEVTSIERNSKTGYIRSDEPDASKPPSPKPQDDADASGDDAVVNAPPTIPVEERKELSAERKQQIKEWIFLLTRQDARKRTRGERFLTEAGEDAIEMLLPVANSASEWTRAAVYRIFKANGDERVVDTALLGLADENQWVRKLAWEALGKVSGKSWAYAWQDSASERQRIKSRRVWIDWWGAEKERLEKLKAEAAAQAVGKEASAAGKESSPAPAATQAPPTAEKSDPDPSSSGGGDDDPYGDGS